MRRAVLLIAVLASPLAAGASSADRTVTSPGNVIALARSGLSVAFLYGPTKGYCGPRPFLWNSRRR